MDYLEVILLTGYIMIKGEERRGSQYEAPKEWSLESTSDYLEWFIAQTEPTREAIRAYVKLLLARGPQLGRPYVDTLKGSKYPNLKELRVQTQGKKFRIAFLFTEERICLLLIGDVKGGSEDKRFYRKLIAQAESLYEEYLAL
jgi:hypothetical protein